MSINLTFDEAAFVSRRFLPVKVSFTKLFLYVEGRPQIDSSTLFLFNLTQSTLFNHLTWILREFNANPEQWRLKQIPMNSTITEEVKMTIEDRILEFSSYINMFPIERPALQQFTKPAIIFLTEMLLNVIAEQVVELNEE
jgi:hypothetical protein